MIQDAKIQCTCHCHYMYVCSMYITLKFESSCKLSLIIEHSSHSSILGIKSGERKTNFRDVTHLIDMRKWQ